MSRPGVDLYSLLLLVRTGQMGPLMDWVEERGLRAEDLAHALRRPLWFKEEIPPDWPWEMVVHCDLPTVQRLEERGLLSRTGLAPGHAILARAYNPDKRVADWLEQIGSGAGEPRPGEGPAQ